MQSKIRAFDDRARYRSGMRIAAAVATLLSLTVTAVGQSAPTQNGSFSSSYGAPTWGQVGGTTWGTYDGTIGRSGWQFNKTLQPNDPSGSVLSPNQAGSSFDNPATGASLFTPQDTRLKGRDRP